MLDDIREWISDNLRYILLGLAILLILIILFCVVRLVSGAGKKSDESVQAPVTQQQDAEALTEAEAAPAAQTAAPAQAPAVSDETLTRDDAAVLTLVRKYYTAAASKDATTLSTIVSPWNDEVQSIVFGNPDIESYNNLTTYSKKGATDGSYVVYAYYESKITDIETLVPSLSQMYLVTGSNGELVVSSDYDTDQAVLSYVNTVSAQSDVQTLVSDVNAQYQRAVDSDDDLRSYVASLSSAAEETEAEQGDAGSASGETASGGERQMTVTANTGLNIRQTPSTEAAIVGSVYKGAVVTMLEEAEGGWCRIRFDSTTGTVEGYVMLQYLADAS